MLARKVGLAEFGGENDEKLLTELFEVLQAVETDMTLFFRLLADVPVHEGTADMDLAQPLKRAFYDEAQAFGPTHLPRLAAWLRRYAERVRQEGVSDETRKTRMHAVNPKYVLRNYLAQLAIDGLEADDPSLMERLMRVLQRPYDEQPEHDDLAERRPDWARSRPGCSALSCSS